MKTLIEAQLTQKNTIPYYLLLPKNIQAAFMETLERIIISLCFILLPGIVLAAGGDTPVSQGLGYIKEALLGTTGMMIATLAIMGTGLACLFHKMEWKYFGYTIAAIGIVFGAPAIVDAVVGLVKT